MFNPDAPYAVLYGSNGESRFDLITGDLESPYGEDKELVRVDLLEHWLAYGKPIEQGDSFDVLDLAGWDNNGRWGPAEQDWREECLADWLADSDEPPTQEALYYLTFGHEASSKHKMSDDPRCVVEHGRSS